MERGVSASLCGRSSRSSIRVAMSLIDSMG